MSNQTVKHIPILMYHSISSSSNPRFKRLTVSAALFDKQMSYLSQYQYTPLTVTQLTHLRTQDKNVWPAHPVVITFDDGFADFFTTALPILKKYAFPATLYISTAFIDGTGRWLRREKETARPMLTWEQIAEINVSGIECGAHTHTHPQLDTLSLPEAKQEIEYSKKLLEDHLGQEIISFAYPFGYHTTRIQSLVQETGFLSACAVKYAMSTEHDHIFSLPRLMVENMSEETFASLITAPGNRATTPLSLFYTHTRRFGWRQARRSAAIIERRLFEQRRKHTAC